MTEMSDRWVSLSLYVDQVMGYRQICKTQIIPHFIRNVFFKGSRVCFCPHATTHADLPWSVPDWEEPKITQYLSSVNLQAKISENEVDVEDWLNRFLAPKKVPCLIVNLTYLLNRLDSFLEKNTLWDTNTDHLRWDLTSKDFMKLYDSLHIGKDILHDALDGYEVRGKLLVLHTGWLDTFYRKNQDYSDPLNECFRTYLCHPYLMQEEAIWLLDHGTMGVAVDFPSPDEPFYYIGQQTKIPYLQEATESLPRSLAAVRPVHVCLLSQEKMLIENIANLSKIQNGSEKITDTQLFIVPLQLRIRDSSTLQIYWTPESPI